MPALFTACLVKFLFTDAIKFDNLDALKMLMTDGGTWFDKLTAGGMSTDQVIHLLSSQFEEMMSKVMKAIPIKEVDNNEDGPGSGLQRLKKMLTEIQTVSPDAVVKEIAMVLALLAPADADIDMLAAALEEVAKDQPSPLVAPYTGCPSGKAIVKRALMWAEQRETERHAAERLAACEILLHEIKEHMERPDDDNANPLDQVVQIRGMLKGLELTATLQAKEKKFVMQLDDWVEMHVLKPIGLADSGTMSTWATRIQEGQDPDEEVTKESDLQNLNPMLSTSQVALMSDYTALLSLATSAKQSVLFVKATPEPEVINNFAATLSSLK